MRSSPSSPRDKGGATLQKRKKKHPAGAMHALHDIGLPAGCFNFFAERKQQRERILNDRGDLRQSPRSARSITIARYTSQISATPSPSRFDESGARLKSISS